MGAPTLSCQLVHISCNLAGSRVVPIAASMSDPLIGLPSSVPFPLPYDDAIRVVSDASWSEAPGRVGAGSVRPFFIRSSLRRVSADTPATPLNRAAPIAFFTLSEVASARAFDASASVSSVMYVALTQAVRFQSSDRASCVAAASLTKASASAAVGLVSAAKAGAASTSASAAPVRTKRSMMILPMVAATMAHGRRGSSDPDQAARNVAIACPSSGFTTALI